MLQLVCALVINAIQNDRGTDERTAFVIFTEKSLRDIIRNSSDGYLTRKNDFSFRLIKKTVLFVEMHI